MYKKIATFFSIKLKTSQSLKSRAIRSSGLLSLGSGFERIIRFVRTMILARLVAPEDFGIIAIAMMAGGIIETITDTGVRLSIIQNKRGSEYGYLNVAWWSQVCRGLIIFSIAVTIAPAIASFYENAELVDILRVSFVTILIGGFISPKVTLLEREFRFGKWALITQLASLIGTCVTVAIAFYVRNAWAIVLGSVIERLVYLAISFVFCPFCPNLNIEKDSLADIFKFAKGMFGLSFMNLIAQQADIFVLGKLVPSSMLGIYFLTVSLTNQPFSLFTGIISPVLLPAIAAKQEDASSLKRSIKFLVKGISIFGIPLSTVIAVHGFALLTIIYGEKYSPGAAILAIFAFNIFFKIQTVVLAQVFFGTGNPKKHRDASIVRTIFIVTLIWPAAYLYGPVGAAVIITISNSILVLMQVGKLENIVEIKVFDYLNLWLPGIVLAAVAGIPLIFYELTPYNSNFFQVIFGTTFFGISCALGLILMKNQKFSLQ